MYKLREVQSVQVEISSHCNAACPQCPRNFFGGSTLPDLPLRRWSLAEFKNIFTLDFLQQLENFYFCGTYGDPMTNNRIVDMCQFLRNNNPKIKIGIHTNGGAGKKELYQNLATTVDFIAFGLDGLNDTNHVYRRRTNWRKIMQHARSFIDAGGYAIWDFIVFQHNEHQVDQAHKLSQEIGFKEFCVKKTGRFLTRAHELIEYQNVLDPKGFVEYKIKPPTQQKYVNDGFDPIAKMTRSEFQHYLDTCQIKCNAEKIREIYIGADGFVFPCGWLHDRLYGPEVSGHKDHAHIKTLMNQIGGWHHANIFYNDLRNIVDGAWFEIISNSWADSNRIERCAMMCGDRLNIIGPQNSNINYRPRTVEL